MIAAHGEERCAQILGIGWRLQLFPNAAFANNQIRIIRPISIDKTEILQYHVVLPGTSDQQKTAGVKGHQSFYGPAGYGSSDDIEMFGRMFEGYRSSDLKSLNQWALFSARPPARDPRPQWRAFWPHEHRSRAARNLLRLGGPDEG